MLHSAWSKIILPGSLANNVHGSHGSHAIYLPTSLQGKWTAGLSDYNYFLLFAFWSPS